MCRLVNNRSFEVEGQPYGMEIEVTDANRITLEAIIEVRKKLRLLILLCDTEQSDRERFSVVPFPPKVYRRSRSFEGYPNSDGR